MVPHTGKVFQLFIQSVSPDLWTSLFTCLYRSNVIAVVIHCMCFMAHSFRSSERDMNSSLRLRRCAARGRLFFYPSCTFLLHVTFLRGVALLLTCSHLRSGALNMTTDARQPRRDDFTSLFPFGEAAGEQKERMHALFLFRHICSMMERSMICTLITMNY